MILAASVLFLAAQSGLYEEDPLATMRVRVDNWKQIEAYAAALPASPAPARRPAQGNEAARIRAALLSQLGYPPPGFHAQVKERLEKSGEDHTAIYHRCRIEVAQGMDAYGLYIVPKNRRGRAPLVISCHGGGGFPEMATFQGGANYHDMVRGAVAAGYAVYAPLAVMYPYRDRDHGTAIPEKVRGELDAVLRTKGTSLVAVEMAKLSKALDALLKRPEIDPARVGMVGLSFGGAYTVYAAALDPRIRAAVASCSFRDRSGQPAGPGGPPAGVTPGELAALIAPRPLQVQAGRKDKLIPVDSVRAAAAAARERYAGNESRFAYEEFDGGHEFRGAPAWAFLEKHLRGEK